jgi:hypothetical protein
MPEEISSDNISSTRQSHVLFFHSPNETVAVARDGPFFLLGACDTADPVAVPNLEPDAEAPAPTVAADPGQDALDGGAVFILSNEAEGNAVLAFERASDGTLAPAGTFPTEGLGSGDGLKPRTRWPWRRATDSSMPSMVAAMKSPCSV